MSGTRLPRLPASSSARPTGRQYGCDFISAMPTNLYGPGDNYDLSSSHVIPGPPAQGPRRQADSGADEMVVWGSGTPLREFLHVDDCADALVHLLKNYSGERHVNVGFGSDCSIADLARLIADVVGFEGDLRFDATKPDGTPRKLMDSSRLAALGWRPRISLRDGLARTYRDFLEAEGAGQLRQGRHLRARPGALPRNFAAGPIAGSFVDA